MVAGTLARLRSDVPRMAVAQGVWRDLDGDLERLIGTLTLPYLFSELEAFQFSARGSRIVGSDALQEFLSSRGQVDFERAPRLRALVDASVAAWYDGIVTMVRRLQKDLPVLRGSLLPTSTRRVTGISRSLSEHIRGASVRRITFDDGAQVVYKPRSVGAESTWARLVERINGLGTDHELQAAKALDAGAYGWCQYIPSRELASRACARDYYFRIGALLCWLRNLGTRDAVRSNLIAAGSSPVLVDCETIFYPRPSRSTRIGTDPTGDFTVIDTGMLPLPQSVAGGGETYTSAITIAEPQTTTALACVSSDRGLFFQRTSIPAPGPECVPMLDGRAVEATDYLDDIERGFATAYELAMRRDREIGAILTDICSDASVRVRYACRPTVVYTEILHRVILAVSGFLEMSRVRDLLRSLPLAGDVEDTEALVGQEWEHLRRCATPRFTVEVQGEAYLQPGGIRLEAYESGVAAARRRLAALHDDDLMIQLALIEKTVGSPTGRRT